MNGKTTLLIVDDSGTFRSLMEEAVRQENDIQVVGAVARGEDALTFIRRSTPDVVTLDVEMPGMNGLETLEAIKAFNRERPETPGIGVIMVSAHTKKGADITMRALEIGAFDFITKPASDNIQESLNQLRRQLLVKIRHYSVILDRKQRNAQETTFSRESDSASGGGVVASGLLVTTDHPVTNATNMLQSSPRVSHKRPSKVDALLIGVSTGGPKALMEILPPISEQIQVPIFIVQHMPAPFTASFAQSLQQKCRHTAIEGRDGEPVRPQYIYVAPGGKHMVVRRNLNTPVIIINETPPENGFRPSVDVLFRSAAQVFGAHSVALLLTGMGSDGALGMGTLKRSGAWTIAQDEASSVVWGMPGSAVSAGVVDEILSLSAIPPAVIQLVRGA